MNMLDILIVIALIWAAVGGWQRGVIYKLVSLIGFVLSIIIAFSLKNVVTGFLYGFCPFFKFSGVFEYIII